MIRVVYGVEEGLPSWEELDAQEVALRLQDIGCDSVFIKHLEPAWVEALHDAGLSVFASFGVFIDNSALDPVPLWDRWPESRPVTAAGTPAPQQDWYRPLLPSHPRVRAHRLMQLEALAARLPLDGIWLDFIRWPGRWENPHPDIYHSSFDAITLRQFQMDTGIALPEAALAAGGATVAKWVDAEVAEVWLAWRCQQIASFVGTARAILRRNLPRALLGLFTVPWVGTQPNALPVGDAHIRIWGQNPALLSQSADVLSPMVYHRLCGQPVEWIEQVTEQVTGQVFYAAKDYSAEKDGNTAVWPVVEAIDPPEQYSADEFEAACQRALAAPPHAVILFKLAGLLQDPEKVKRWCNLHLP